MNLKETFLLASASPSTVASLNLKNPPNVLVPLFKTTVKIELMLANSNSVTVLSTGAVEDMLILFEISSTSSPKQIAHIPKEEELFEARSLPERDMFEDCPFKSRTIA